MALTHEKKKQIELLQLHKTYERDNIMVDLKKDGVIIVKMKKSRVFMIFCRKIFQRYLA